MSENRLFTDPIELIIASALDVADVSYDHETSGKTNGLDFYIEEFDTYIECKQFHTPRISDQMKRADNIIAIQGRKAAIAFAQLLGDFK